MTQPTIVQKDGIGRDVYIRLGHVCWYLPDFGLLKDIIYLRDEHGTIDCYWMVLK